MKKKVRDYINKNLLMNFYSLGFTILEKDGFLLKESKDYKDRLSYGFAQKNDWIVGSIRLGRKIQSIEVIWEDQELYLRGSRSIFNSTVYSDPRNEAQRLQVNTLKMKSSEMMLEKKIVSFFTNALQEYLIPDIDYKSRLDILGNTLNQPYNKPVIGTNWFRKIIVAKFNNDPNLVLIYDYIFNHFKKMSKVEDDLSSRTITVLKIIRERLAF